MQRCPGYYDRLPNSQCTVNSRRECRGLEKANIRGVELSGRGQSQSGQGKESGGELHDGLIAVLIDLQYPRNDLQVRGFGFECEG